MERPVAAAPAKPAPAPEAPKKKSRKLVWIVLVLVLLGGGGGGAFWFLRGHGGDAQAAAPKEQAPPQYIALEPAFVVNLADTDAVRYLQAAVQLMTRDPDTAAAVTLHAPSIRNRLLLLFGQQSSQQLNGRSGKERLQQQALAEVRAVLKGQRAADKVDALLFTSLVTQ